MRNVRTPESSDEWRWLVLFLFGGFVMDEKRSRWTDRSVGIAEAGGTIPWLIIKMVQGIARTLRKVRGK
jgi:hypothetical protein